MIQMNPNLVEKYLPFIRNLSQQYSYDSNITHLLYLILPAFVTKYSIYQEKLILNTFQQTQIIISPKTSPTIEAYYTSIPKYQNTQIITQKYIIIQNYKNISLVQLLDNLVHEFNHAINSFQHEIQIQDNTLTLRTGLTHVSYSLPDLNPIQKEDSYLLEEILNTHQTEQIMNIIKTYHDPNHDELNNTIYSLNQETPKNYTSKSYYLENLLMKRILENKTFIFTLNNLRLAGNVDDIEYWFNHITNQKNSYQSLNQHLQTIQQLEHQLTTQKFLQSITIYQIKKNITQVLTIIDTFNQNCNYK